MLPLTNLLAFARELQRAATFADVLTVTREETARSLGYQHVWVLLAEDESAEELRIIDATGKLREPSWEAAPIIRVKGDAMLEEVLRGDAPVVVDDARTDPRTDKRITETLGSRTVIHVPFRLLDKPFGVLGTGTFADEGCRPPTPEQLDYLIGMAGQLSVAVARIRFLEERARAERERLELERRIFRIQKLESLGMLAGGIAHDFNNLLTVILTGAGLVRLSIESAPLQADLDAVIEAAKRGSDLTRQLLAMSRSQSLDLRSIDLNVRLRDLAKMLRRVLPENIVVDLILPGRLPPVRGDGPQLDQVFMNLALNARDAMPAGGRLTLETEQVLVNGGFAKTHPWAKPGRYVLVTVTDTGVGMTADIADRVFEPFFTTKKDRGGTGLGLAVAYGIVRQHEGMLHCYSEPGVGTTFKVYLPIEARAAEAVGTKLEGPVPGGTERILVVEDDGSVRSVVQRILELSGYRVTAVDNGAAACELARREPFDLVLLDLVMPGMTGIETMERIAPLLPAARFLLSTGYGGDATPDLARAGVVELLPKPHDPDRLLRAVRRALDGGKV